MTQVSDEFNVENYVQQEKEKYTKLIEKYLSTNNHETIDIIGAGKGKYYKVEDYYIIQNECDWTYYIVKNDEIENNRIKSCVYISNDLFENVIRRVKIDNIKYLIQKEERNNRFEEYNINCIISNISFNNNGELQNIKYSKDVKDIIKPEERINDINNNIQEIDKKITRYHNLIRYFIQDVGKLKEQKENLINEKYTIEKVNIIPKELEYLIIKIEEEKDGESLEMAQISGRLEQYYATKEYLNNKREK